MNNKYIFIDNVQVEECRFGKKKYGFYFIYILRLSQQSPLSDLIIVCPNWKKNLTIQFMFGINTIPRCLLNAK